MTNGIQGTTEEFIKRSEAIHGQLYDYSKADYRYMKSHVTIICKQHGEFRQLPQCHIHSKSGCPKCSLARRAKKRTHTKAEFIKRAEKRHGSKYDYSKTIYAKSQAPLTIICPNHGEFQQSPSAHIQGAGCPACSRERTIKGVKKNTDCFIKKAKQIHGDAYNYSKVNYTRAIDKVTIVCPQHGNFYQNPHNHLLGKGCRDCAFERIRERHVFTTEEFIERAQEIFGDLYDYSLVKYVNATTPIEIICPEHGEFLQTPGTHIYAKCGCPICGRYRSRGEEKIEKVLKRDKINYTRFKKFKECRDIYPLEFDFYLPRKQTLIEYDGKQHFELVEYFGGQSGFESLQRRDKIKNRFAKENGYNLIRIPYFKYDEIPQILSNIT